MKTIILRFRDLATVEGETIRTHSEIIDSKGYVWWGWWAKAGEKVPFEAFRSLIQASPIQIFLFDSGSKKLFKAMLADIHYDRGGRRISTPESESTPTYYRNSDYLAWYKLTSIVEVETAEDTLKAYSYEERAEAFESGEAQFNMYHGKVVVSLNELKVQERTIWFLRDAIPGTDSYQEVLLYPSSKTLATDFGRSFEVMSRGDILWVSDLHFGDNRFPEVNDAGRSSLANTLDDGCKTLGLSPAAVVISGDLTKTCRPAEFDLAKKFIDQIATLQRIDGFNFIIAPGNHDFEFETPLNELDPAEPVSPVLREKAIEFRKLYKSLFHKEPNEHYCSGRRYILNHKYPVEIVSLNSYSFQQVRGQFQGLGYVGIHQLGQVAKEFEWEKPRGKEKPFRIAVMHGHVVPVTFTEVPKHNARYSLTLDAESVIRWCIANGVDMLLHGHMHQPHYVKVSRPQKITDSKETDFVLKELHICGLGTSSSSDLGEIGCNTFGAISFSDNKVTIKIYSIRPDQAVRNEDLLAKFDIPMV